jgi:hypothetical protein
MARVYRDARTGQLGTSDASRPSFILQALGRLIEGSEMERRLATLENWLQVASETKREREWSDA